MKIIVFFGCFPRRRSCSTNGIWVGRWRFTKNIWRKHEALYLYQLGRWTLLYQIVFFLGPTPNTIIYEIWKDLFFSFPQRSSESVPGRQFFWLHVYKLWKYNIRCFSSPCWANFNHGPLCHTRQWFWAPMSTYIILHIYTGAKFLSYLRFSGHPAWTMDWEEKSQRSTSTSLVFVAVPVGLANLAPFFHELLIKDTCPPLHPAWSRALGPDHSPPSRSIRWRTPISAPPPLNCE